MWFGIHVLIQNGLPQVVTAEVDDQFSPEARAAMANIGKWVPLSELVHSIMPVEEIRKFVRPFDKGEGLFTLARIAADLANAEGGPMGRVARSWTNDLLIQRIGSKNPVEDAVSRAVRDLGSTGPIAHAHVVYVLQQLLLAEASFNGQRPHDGQLAFLMLALNDHISGWRCPSEESSLQVAVANTLFAMLFNRSSDDLLRFLVRTKMVLSEDPSGGPIAASDWAKIQQRAFGCPFSDYVDLYLVPLTVLASGWGSKDPPVLFREVWEKGGVGYLFRTWLDDASVPLEDAPTVLASERLPSGLPALSGAFFRKPFIETEGRLVALSPWHVWDHVAYGSWAKLNIAAKTVLGSSSNQSFTSTFGYLFERWCRTLARKASQLAGFPDELVLPSRPGADDEIEDIVFVNGNLVTLMSAKSSLVPEQKLKTAGGPGDVIAWLQRFFFEDPATARGHRHRGGAAHLLDEKVLRLRAGGFESRGLSRDAVVLPVVVMFDRIGDGGPLYRWLSDECTRLGLLNSRPGVRPLTVLAPEDFESLLALGSRLGGVCHLLSKKTESPQHLKATDWFLYELERDARKRRLPFIEDEFRDIVQRSSERRREMGVFGEPLRERDDV